MANGLAFSLHPAEGEPEAYNLFSFPYQFFPFSVPLIPLDLPLLPERKRIKRKCQ